MRYRMGFPSIGASGFESDIGWGCMHRTGQMALAQALLFHILGRDWRNSSDPLPKEVYHILQKFSDRETSPYSIHQLCMLGSQQGKPIGQWFGPAGISNALRGLVNRTELDLRVYTSDDGMIYKSEISEITEGWNKSLLMVISLRMSLSSVPETYYKAIQTVFEFKSSVGILGGKPNSSFYFI